MQFFMKKTGTDNYSYWTDQDKYFELKNLIVQHEQWDGYELWIDNDSYFKLYNEVEHEENWNHYSHWVRNQNIANILWTIFLSKDL